MHLERGEARRAGPEEKVQYGLSGREPGVALRLRAAVRRIKSAAA